MVNVAKRNVNVKWQPTAKGWMTTRAPMPEPQCRNLCRVSPVRSAASRTSCSCVVSSPVLGSVRALRQMCASVVWWGVRQRLTTNSRAQRWLRHREGPIQRIHVSRIPQGVPRARRKAGHRSECLSFTVSWHGAAPPRARGRRRRRRTRPTLRNPSDRLPSDDSPPAQLDRNRKDPQAVR